MKQTTSFFSRMLLICTTLLTIFSMTTSILVINLSYQYEKNRFLGTYDMAALNLYKTMEDRFEHFHSLTRKLISGSSCNSDLCDLLEIASFEEVPASTRSNCIALMTELRQDVSYLSGFLVYSPEYNNLYYYGGSQAHLSCAYQIPNELTHLSPFQGSILDINLVETILNDCGVSLPGSYYGIAATIYRSTAKPLGYLIPLFSTSGFHEILSNYNIETDSVFTIQTPNHSLFFHSNPKLELNPNYTYSSNQLNSRYHFEVSYQVSRLQLPLNSYLGLFLLLAALVTLFSFILYYVTCYITNRNLNHILNGMKQFSVKNLSYRISHPDKRNEFTQLIEHFNNMCNELERSVKQAYVYELQQKKSELYALQTSINPHFLYNTLEMIRRQVLSSRPNEASQMILLLSKIYRSQTNTQIFVTLSDEAELCENLMILYQYRFQNFEYDFDLDPSIEHFGLPKNTLQPLIENYFVHGIIAESHDNLILLRITSYEENGELFIRLILCNNGHSIDEARIQELSERLNGRIYDSTDSAGFALTNIYSRLKIAFHEHCRLQISSGDDDMNYQVELCFPARTIEQIKESILS